MSPCKLPPFVVSGFLSVLLFAPSLGAQVASAATPPATDKIVEISPFEVRTDRDTGWVASSTLAGNRMDTELVNVGASIDAITSEFMRDLAVYKLEDIAQFVAGVDVVNEHETGAEENRVNFRGMQLGGREVAQSSRNFFPWFTPTDSYNIDRIDFSKGSNSLIYGDSIPGGMANSYTKRPRFKNSGEFTLRYDTFGSHRAQLDVNRKLHDKVALRLNLVDRDDKSYLDHAHSSLRAIHGAISFRPLRHTQVRFEAEKGKFERIRGTNTLTVRPNSAPGLGFSTANRWYVTSDGDIRYVTTANTSAVDRSAAAGTVVSLMEGQTATVSLLNRVGNGNVASGQTVTLSGYPRETSLRGAIDFLDRPYTTYTAYLEQQIGKLAFEFAFNRQDQEQQRTDGTFDGVVSVDRNGRPFSDFSINDRTFGDHVRIVRATASYPFEFGKWMKQFVVVSAETQRDQLYNFRRNMANYAALDNGPVTISNHQVLFRAYLDDPRFPGSDFWEQFRPENLPETATFRPGWYNTTTTDLPFIDIRSSRAYSASVAGRYWKDRIHTLVGVRYDEFKRKRITDLPTDAIGQFVYLGDDKSAPDAYSYDSAYDLNHTSYTGSLVYKVNEATSLYATYAESFRWQPYEDFTGKPLGPVVGETYEAGVKTALFNRRVFATFGVYRTDRTNTRYTWSPNNLTAAEMEDLFNPANLRPGDPGYFLPAPGANDEFRTVPSTERAEGFESTLQFQRIRGIQARLTFSHNKIAVVRDFSLFREYLEAAIARGGESPTLIADGQSILAANDGVEKVTGSRSSENSINWTFDYQFPRDSWLKGTRAAIYGNWRDKYNMTLLNDVMYRGGATHPVGAYLMHQRKVFGRATSFRVGFKNIIDLENNDDMRVTGVREIDARGLPTNYIYRYITPFSADFSVTMDF
jgi:outer membrane receptor for ferric coprogen and ferric-rhodotorulic acid